MKLEEIEQRNAVQYLQILERQGKILAFFAPMNENVGSWLDRRSAIKIEAKAKAMGKRSGVSDLVIVLHDRVLFVEMKRQCKKLKNGKISKASIAVSEKQKLFLGKVGNSSVCEAVVCYGFAEFRDFLEIFLKTP